MTNGYQARIQRLKGEPDETPNLTEIRIGGRLLRDFYCGICQPAIKGTRVPVTWHDPSSKCELTSDIHCNCRPCSSIVP